MRRISASGSGDKTEGHAEHVQGFGNNTRSPKEEYHTRLGFGKRSNSALLSALVCTLLASSAQGQTWPDARTTLEALTLNNVKNAQPVGTTSVVFRFDLEGDIDAAFKPATYDEPTGYMSEVAAYRLATALGIDNVPFSEERELARSQIRDVMPQVPEPKWIDIRQHISWDPAGNVKGAMIFWVPKLTPSGLDSSDGVQQWSGWLSQRGAPPPEQATIAKDISTLVVFDYLIGNWDRYSGGNLGIDVGRKRVVMRDHNVAFQTPFPARFHERVFKTLRRVEKFSKSFMQALLDLDESKLRASLVRISERGLLLNDAQIQEFMDRRRTVLSRVATLIEEYGTEKVLVFP